MLVETVLKHDAGLASFPRKFTTDEIKTENIKKNSIGSVAEAAKPILGDRRQYHAVTRDWLSGEIFRRVEPEGRTYGEY
jgi:hypothetical protein